MKAVFLDLNGVISKESDEYIKNWDEFHFLPGSKEAVAKLSKHFPVIVISNQSGIGRGLMPESNVIDINNKMIKEIEAAGGKVTGIFYCPHKPEDNCNCRKPKTQLIEEAANRHNIDLKASYMVGDKPADVQLARNAGCTAILVRTGYGSNYNGPEPDIIAKDLKEAAEQILSREQA